MLKKIVFPVLFLIFLLATIISFILDADMFRFPMMLTTFIITALWAFSPKDNSSVEGNAAFYALISYSIFSVFISYVLYIIIPIYGEQWGVDYHPDDTRGVTYPLVNDMHENCIFTSIIFLIFFGIASFKRIKAKIKK